MGNIIENIVSLISSIQKTSQLTCKGMILVHFLISCPKMNARCIKDINVKFEPIKLLEGNTGSMLCDISLSNLFSKLSPLL